MTGTFDAQYQRKFWRADKMGKLQTVAGLLVCVFLAVAMAHAQAPKTAPKPAAPAKRQITAEEKVYAGAAMSYLKTAHDHAAKVTTTMAGASTGKSTLTDIENAVNRASSIENVGYVGDYKNRIKSVPPMFAATSRDIDEAHRLFQSAMTEYKQFFKTQSSAYITSAQGPFKRSMELQAKAITDITKKLDSVRP